MDAMILKALNGLATSSTLFRMIAIVGGSYFIWTMAALAVVVTWKRTAMTRGFIATAIILTTNYAIAYLLYFRQRPSEGVLRLIEPYSTKSFPSDHAAIATALAWTVASVHPRLGILMAFSALLVALGRIALGVHYPSDVLAGFIVGTVAYFTAKWLLHEQV
jgi:undecaprenyl-diphosphatase